jgi:CBS-domain-containing membrane protein
MQDICVKDVMSDVFDFPHIPYWFSLRQAMKIIRITCIKAEKSLHPTGMLVFDEGYNLLGHLTLKDILKGLEDRSLKTDEPAQSQAGSGAMTQNPPSNPWNTTASREMAEKPVSEFMAAAMHFVSPDDPVSKAACLMIHNDLALLPALDQKSKFVGVVRLDAVLEAMFEVIMKE